MRNNFVSSIGEILGKIQVSDSIKESFLTRAKEGNVTRDENPRDHFCVYFAGYDPEKKLVFVGHHIKSGLWLFNGGHIDKGELPLQAVAREIGEEWGDACVPGLIPDPGLLTIAQIEHPEKMICEKHYDIWYFIPLNSNTFAPDEKLLAKEFHAWGWKTIPEARAFIREKNTQAALDYIENAFFETA